MPMTKSISLSAIGQTDMGQLDRTRVHPKRLIPLIISSSACLASRPAIATHRCATLMTVKADVLPGVLADNKNTGDLFLAKN